MPAIQRRHWLLLTLILLATFCVRARLGGSPVVPLRQPLSQFPAQVGRWHVISQPVLGADVLSVLKADDYMMRDYATAQGRQAQLFVAYYRSQHAGESMHSPKNCLPGSGWEPIQSDYVRLAAGPEINRYVIGDMGDRELVLYWYQAQGRIIASEYWGKIYLVWDAMREGRRDGAIVRVLVPMQPNESVAKATQDALSLANPSLPVLRNFLPN
ncbi:MAG TPA: EpsI family protein [Terriglobales bacterium]|nr:EpsI family protein [Terriglobales bacterium]